MQSRLLAMADAQVSGQGGFVPGAPKSEWYENLRRYGSCLKVLALLRVDRSLILHLGPEAITALHKGVEHGCVALVKFILVELFDEQGLCNCVQHDADDRRLTREGLLRKTNSYGSTAVNVAVVSGSPKMVLLLDWAIQMTQRTTTGEKTGGMAEQNRGEDVHFLRTSFQARSRNFLENKSRRSAVPSEVRDETEVTSLPVPDVEDEDIFILQNSSSVQSVIPPKIFYSAEIISVVESVFEDPGDLDEEC